MVPWENCIVSSGLSILIFEIRIIRVPTSRGNGLRTYGVHWPTEDVRQILQSHRKAPQGQRAQASHNIVGSDRALIAWRRTSPGAEYISVSVKWGEVPCQVP